MWDAKHVGTEYTEINRFNLLDKIDFGKGGADNLHPGANCYKEYGIVLCDYIKLNFPGYLKDQLYEEPN